jgi:hypothetical protein
MKELRFVGYSDDTFSEDTTRTEHDNCANGEPIIFEVKSGNEGMLVYGIYGGLEGTPGCNTTLALRVVFDPLAKRYNNGERSQELYDEMMAVE